MPTTAMRTFSTETLPDSGTRSLECIPVSLVILTFEVNGERAEEYPFYGTEGMELTSWTFARKTSGGSGSLPSFLKLTQVSLVKGS